MIVLAALGGWVTGGRNGSRRQQTGWWVSLGRSRGGVGADKEGKQGESQIELGKGGMGWEVRESADHGTGLTLFT